MTYGRGHELSLASKRADFSTSLDCRARARSVARRRQQSPTIRESRRAHFYGSFLATRRADRHFGRARAGSSLPSRRRIYDSHIDTLIWPARSRRPSAHKLSAESRAGAQKVGGKCRQPLESALGRRRRCLYRDGSQCPRRTAATRCRLALRRMATTF